MRAVKIQVKDRWAVWNKKGHRPFAFHLTRDEALAEATRLARLLPRDKFHVIYFDVKVSAVPDIAEACPTCGPVCVMDKVARVAA